MQQFTIYRGVHSCGSDHVGWMAHATILAIDMAEAIVRAKQELGNALHKVVANG